LFLYEKKMAASNTKTKIFNILANYRKVEGTRRCQEMRQLRNKIPGVLYGGPRNKENILVQTDQFDVAELLRNRGQSFSSTLVDVRIEDEEDPKGKEIKTFRCVPRSITLHHLYDYPVSCNWMIHDPVKGVKVNLPIFFEDKDKCPGLKRGAVLSRIFWHLPCLVKGPSLPDGISLSVAGMQVGDRLRWSDINWKQLPEGVSVECLMFRMPSFKKSNMNNLTLVSVEGGKGAAAEEEQKKEESLESF
jgi:large subunit ribosomal protein L25